MDRSLVKMTLATLTLTAMSAVVAQAAVTTTLPAGVEAETVESVFEARGRVDGYQSQTWKTALWGESGSTPVTQGAIVQNYYQDGETYDWTFEYDASTGVVNWSIEGLSDLDATFQLTEGKDLVGFKMYTRADEASTGGSTVLSNIQVTYNGQTESINDLFSGNGNGLWVERTMYFGQDVESFTLTGDVTFDWLDVKKTKTERYKFGVKAVQGVANFGGGTGGGTGTVIPSPAAIWAGVTLIGYAVMRRTRNDKKADQA